MCQHAAHPEGLVTDAYLAHVISQLPTLDDPFDDDNNITEVEVGPDGTCLDGRRQPRPKSGRCTPPPGISTQTFIHNTHRGLQATKERGRDHHAERAKPINGPRQTWNPRALSKSSREGA